MRRGLLATWFLVVAVVGLLVFVPAASAGNVDFSCATSNCTGTVTNASNNFSTTGITLYNSGGPYLSTTPFTLVFNTNTASTTLFGSNVIGSGNGTISITGGGDTLLGTFTGFTYAPGSTTATLTLAGVVWSTLPSLVQAALGTPTGIDNGTVTFILASGAAQSVDILITPTPEPGSLMLLGSGLLLGGGILRRKLRL